MKENTAPHQLLREFEERLLRPDIRRCPEAVQDLLADGFMEFGSSGRIFHKQQTIEALRGEAMTSRRSILDFRLLAPGAVLVTYRLARSDCDGEAPTYSLRSSIWKLIAGRWQMVFHQGTASPAA
jgi:hypothetical protein